MSSSGQTYRVLAHDGGYAYAAGATLSSLKATLGIDEITPENLGAIALASPPLPALLAFINALPKPEV